MITFSKSIARAALFACAGSLVFAMPLKAAPVDDANSPQNTAQNQTAPDQDNNSAPQPMHKMHGRAEVETRIQTLHDKLKITSAEESDWDKVAEAMRDNEASIHQLIQERHRNPDNMTAVDDLQSYQKIAQAHADGLQKLTDAFQTLYGDMSDAQKKNADDVFGKFEGHRGNTTVTKKHS